MSSNSDFTDGEIEIGLEELRVRLAREGRGRLDDARVFAMLRQVVERHRERDSVLLLLMARPSAHFVMRPVEDDPMLLEVRLAVRKRDGEVRSVHAATVPLPELLRGPTG